MTSLQHRTLIDDTAMKTLEPVYYRFGHATSCQNQVLYTVNDPLYLHGFYQIWTNIMKKGLIIKAKKSEKT